MLQCTTTPCIDQGQYYNYTIHLTRISDHGGKGVAGHKEGISVSDPGDNIYVRYRESASTVQHNP